MNTQKLLLDRIEFLAVKIESVKAGKFEGNKAFPQLNIDFSKIGVLTRSSLNYGDEEVSDPRHFALTYGVKIDKDQPEGAKVPYVIEVEVVGFFRYTGGDEFVGEDRFRAVRFSGYQLLYGAIREMVANITARARHGLLQLPARTFGVIAKERAAQDEVERQERLQKQLLVQVRSRGKRAQLKMDVQVPTEAVKPAAKRRLRKPKVPSQSTPG